MRNNMGDLHQWEGNELNPAKSELKEKCAFVD